MVQVRTHLHLLQRNPHRYLLQSVLLALPCHMALMTRQKPGGVGRTNWMLVNCALICTMAKRRSTSGVVQASQWGLQSLLPILPTGEESIPPAATEDTSDCVGPTRHSPRPEEYCHQGIHYPCTSDRKKVVHKSSIVHGLRNTTICKYAFRSISQLNPQYDLPTLSSCKNNCFTSRSNCYCNSVLLAMYIALFCLNIGMIS